MSSAAGTRTAVAANQIRRDLGYARERTLATGIRAWVVFSPGTNSYSVLEEPIGNPGRSNALTMTDPVTGRTFAQSLSAPEFAGTVLVSAVFDSGSEVGFDWKGRPLNATGALLAAQGVVTLSGGRTVTVKAGSGLADTP